MQAKSLQHLESDIASLKHRALDGDLSDVGVGPVRFGENFQRQKGATSRNIMFFPLIFWLPESKPWRFREVIHGRKQLTLSPIIMVEWKNPP